MPNCDRIGTLYNTAEKLIGVRYSVFDSGLDERDWIDAIEMRFEGAVATVYGEANFDTLRLELSELTVRADCHIKIATLLEPWKEIVGRSPAWIWLLRNQQGYEDGFRFEFPSKEAEGTRKIITLIATASRIQIYLSQEINLTLFPDETAYQPPSAAIVASSSRIDVLL